MTRRHDVHRTRFRRVLPWFSSIDELDRARPFPFPAEARLSRVQALAEVRERVRDLLPHAVDEGSARALDPTTVAWARGWLARVDTEHVDHVAVVERVIGMARERAAAADAAHRSAVERLWAAETDLATARRRLGATPVPALSSSVKEPT